MNASIKAIELFLSTPSARRATWRSGCCGHCRTDFYPRPLRGGRLPVLALFRANVLFLSTPSARRATTIA